jgi:hypothetical protein
MGVRVQRLGKNLGLLNKVKIGTPAGTTSVSVGNQIFFSSTLIGVGWSIGAGNTTGTSTTASSSYNDATASSGKWYWETEIQGPGLYTSVGVVLDSAVNVGDWVGQNADQWGYTGWNGSKVTNLNYSTFGDPFQVGDIIGTALDLDNGRIWWSRNGTFQDSGDPANNLNPAFTGITGTVRLGWGDGSSFTTENITIHSTPATITYSAPSGFAVGFG